MGFEFPPERRIKKRPEFLALQSSGRRAGSKHFLLISAPKEKDLPRLGITITTKVHKRAVKRNLVKRRLRELYRQLAPKFERELDVVIIARSGACELGFSETECQCVELFKKARLLPREYKSSCPG